jgi:hypothetical protein
LRGLKLPEAAETKHYPALDFPATRFDLWDQKRCNSLSEIFTIASTICAKINNVSGFLLGNQKVCTHLLDNPIGFLLRCTRESCLRGDGGSLREIAVDTVIVVNSGVD